VVRFRSRSNLDELPRQVNDRCIDVKRCFAIQRHYRFASVETRDISERREKASRFSDSLEGFKNPRLKNRNRVSSGCIRDVRVLIRNTASLLNVAPTVLLNDRAIVHAIKNGIPSKMTLRYGNRKRKDNTGREGKVDSLRVATSAENAAQSAFIKC